jgi:hypothetical protein
MQEKLNLRGKMNSSKAPSITNIIGVLLVIVAIVSAGGLYYIASEYSKISESIVTVETAISAVTINNISGDYTLTISVLISNPSSLDVEVYRIEYMTYADKSTSTLQGSDRYIGGGSTSDRNSTVSANSVREMQVSHIINPDSIYMKRLLYGMDNGNSSWIFVGGYVWFKIADYPDVTQQLGVGYQDQVVIQNA